jgi:hypothetical protein
MKVLMSKNFSRKDILSFEKYNKLYFVVNVLYISSKKDKKNAKLAIQNQMTYL